MYEIGHPPFTNKSFWLPASIIHFKSSWQFVEYSVGGHSRYYDMDWNWLEYGLELRFEILSADEFHEILLAILNNFTKSWIHSETSVVKRAVEKTLVSVISADNIASLNTRKPPVTAVTMFGSLIRMRPALWELPLFVENLMESKKPCTVYLALLKLKLLMSWQHNEPWQQQTWYFPSFYWILCIAWLPEGTK